MELLTKSTIGHVPTPEECEQIKQAALARADALGQAAPLVFRASFCNDQVQFICQWLDHATWKGIIENADYQKHLETQPEAAEYFLRLKVFQKCVLWPPQFKPHVSEQNQPYPAGVIGNLLNYIMFMSGFTKEVVPDKLIVLPPAPVEPSQEVLEALMVAHPLACKFNLAFEKAFFVRDYVAAIQDYGLAATRYYIYTTIDRQTYQAVQQDQDTGLEIALNNCVLWPVPAALEDMAAANAAKYGPLVEVVKAHPEIPRVAWDDEPAQYGEWLVNSIMLESGFGMDPATGIEAL